ncbi:hypothetical protein [Ancylomarina longa]|uniref:Class I SAM-dependent methyltransferase n=1 Tax=Ancylomarina longa TaxID=2487017 RepID=A0A434AGC5_9BACT|nr:hypothetical protein [Ancylomarina longa]RUT73436.1 hypothetical protein DLK05_13220 [Ancylomarina longa]
MSKAKYQLKKRLYRLKSIRRRRGFGIHSPFVFHLVTNVISAKLNYPALDNMHAIRKQTIDFLKNELQKDSFGTDVSGKLEKEIERIKKEEALDRLIFRVMNFSHPKRPVFMGSELGFTAGYMAKVDAEIPLQWIGNDVPLTLFQDIILNKWFVDNIVFVSITEINELKEIDFIVLSDSCSPELIEELVQNPANILAENSFMIIKNIHKNERMSKLWAECIQWKHFAISLDLFELGILIARRGMRKNDYVIKYRF